MSGCLGPLPPVGPGLPLVTPGVCRSPAAALAGAAPTPATGAGGPPPFVWVGIALAVAAVLVLAFALLLPVVWPEPATHRESPPRGPRCSCGRPASHRVTMPAPIGANPRPFLCCRAAARAFQARPGARVEDL